MHYFLVILSLALFFKGKIPGKGDIQELLSMHTLTPSQQEDMFKHDWLKKQPRKHKHLPIIYTHKIIFVEQLYL